MYQTFTQAIAIMQCPFNKNIVFIDNGFSLEVMINIERLYVTTNFLMNVCTCF